MLYVIDTVYITYALYMVCIVCTVSIVYTVYILIVALSRGFLVFSEIFLTWKKAFKKLSAGKIGHSPPAGGGIRPLDGRFLLLIRRTKKPLPYPPMTKASILYGFMF